MALVRSISTTMLDDPTNPVAFVEMTHSKKPSTHFTINTQQGRTECGCKRRQKRIGFVTGTTVQFVLNV